MLFSPISSIATRDVITLCEQQSVQAAVQLMAEHGIHDVVVTGSDVLRIITTQVAITLRLTGVDFNTSLSQVHLPRVACLHRDEKVGEGLAALQGSPTEHLCLVDDDRHLAGIISYSDLISHLDPKSLAETRCIKDLLALADFLLLSPGDDLKSAMLQMHTAGHSAALIALPDNSIGIITQSDITRALTLNSDWSVPVTAFMTAPALTVKEQLTLQQALTISRQHQLKHLVICNDAGKAVGLLHQKELVALVYESWREVLHRQEEQLRAALESSDHEQRWRAVLEGTEQGVWDWNAQTNKVYFSPTWKSMLGYTEQEIGDSLDEWDSRIHPDDKAGAYADLHRHFSGETEVYENIHRVRCKDGHYKWIRDKGKVFSTDAQGKPLRVIGTHTDVTSEYEQRLKLDRLAENMPGMLYQYCLTPDGRSYFVYATSGIQDIYGVSSAQVKDDAAVIFDNIHVADRDSVSQSIQLSAQTLSVWEQEYRYLHPEKGERWLEGRATPERLAGGTVRWHGYIYDITERKVQQLALEDARTRFQLTMDATDTGLWSWNLLTDEVKWSSQAYQQLGYVSGDLQMSLAQFQRLLHPDDLEPTMTQAMCHIQQHRSFDVQFRLRASDGSWVWLQSRGKVTRTDAAGKPSYMMGTHTNISKIKQVEQALSEAKAMADDANRAKSDFLANMSHEIRTPMTGIIGLSQISANEEDPDKLHERLRKIHQSGRLLLGILNDILDFSRIEAGKLDLDPHPFFLHSLLDNLNSLFAHMAASKTLALNVRAVEGLANTYVGDELRIRQVLTNLLGNAIKFTEQGQVNLLVRCVHSAGGRQQLEFSIEDTGIGIKAEHQVKLFQAFSQADKSITRQHGGSGLGLAISQRLVSCMGGQGIRVRSQPNQGSCFSFVLDLPVATAEQEQQLIRMSAADSGQRLKLQGRVLLVEDNLINQEVAKAQLDDLGLSVTMAMHGADALAQLEQAPFDLVLMDIQMPVMDGYEATRRLRAKGYQKPIIALTAAAMAGDQKMALEAGMNGHLAKPIDTLQLQQVLARWLPLADEQATDSSPMAITALSGTAATTRPCLDSTAGVSMLGGNVTLYRKLLQEFLQQIDADFQPLLPRLQALHAGSPTTAMVAAQRVAHSLKGVAGNLSLYQLADVATELDRCLKQSRPPESEQLQIFACSLEKTAGQIEQWLDEHPCMQPEAQGQSDVVVNEAGYMALEQLIAAVSNSEFLDEGRLDKVAATLPDGQQVLWQQVMTALDEFDFEKAHLILISLLSQLRGQ